MRYLLTSAVWLAFHVMPRSVFPRSLSRFRQHHENRTSSVLPLSSKPAATHCWPAETPEKRCRKRTSRAKSAFGFFGGRCTQLVGSGLGPGRHTFDPPPPVWMVGGGGCWGSGWAWAWLVVPGGGVGHGGPGCSRTGPCRLAWWWVVAWSVGWWLHAPCARYCTHLARCCVCAGQVVPPAGFEPATPALGEPCSIP
jgi:hypothetical protein